MRSTLVAALFVMLAACTAPTAETTDTSAPGIEPPATFDSTSTTTQGPATSSEPTTSVDAVDTPVVATGSKVLVDSQFAAIDGKRVGLIAHQVSVVDGVHLGDLLHRASNVELVAMFGPEHGVRGDADAGEHVADAIDAATGVPVYSLFGATRQPTPEMLAGIDVLLYDLQDVGARYYTYISTMGLAMQVAAELDIEFVVLDRPNPQSNTRIGGDTLIDSNTSFIGMYPLPDLYGLTAGQLAATLVSGQLVPGYEDVDLRVIEMAGWDASMTWDDTGLPWIPPSPALTTPESAYLYPATVYFEATNMSYGRGTEQAFQTLGAPWLDADAAAQALNDRDAIRGVRFAATTITPQLLPGMTVEPAYLGETIPAITFAELDPHDFESTVVAVHLLDVMIAQAAEKGIDILERPEWLDKISGTDLLRTALFSERRSVDNIAAIRSSRIARPESSISYLEDSN